ncbi:hypothetical protein GGI02_000821 [Coemansia sp. RSA 2322]|nr:hypothetical protein GGI02_000821 [Coemansia sp. RSA 2322]
MTAVNLPKDLNLGWWGGNNAGWKDSAVNNNGVANTLVTYLIDKISQDGMPNAKYLQWCGDGDPAKTAGIIIDASGNQEAVRQAMQQWSMGKCWNTKTGESTLPKKDLWFFDYNDRKNGNPANDPNLSSCAYKTVEFGDDMASKCGVTGDALVLYNPGVDFTKLQVALANCLT